METGQMPISSSKSPDGGLEAWLVVLGAWCASFCCFGWVNSIGVFQAYFQSDLLKNYSPSTISWIPSLQIFFIMGLGPVVGKLYDNYGPRRTILVGTFMHVFGLMMTSLSNSYYQVLLGQGVCSAIGVAAVFHPAINSVHGWFDRQKGTAFGILSTGSSIGGIIFPIMVTRIIDKQGFGWAMRISAFMILGLLLITNLTIRNHNPPQPQKWTSAQFLRPMREPEFILLACGFFCLTYGVFIPINYLPTQAQSVGVNPKLTQYLASILNAGSLFGRLSSGILADKIGRYNTFIIVCYLTTIWILALWIPTNTQQAIIAFAALFGFSSGAYISLISPLVAQVSSLHEIGLRTGLIYLGCAIGGLTTNPISGAIVSGSLGWTGPKVFAGLFCFVGTTSILMARAQCTGWKVGVVF
ncbi:hypothetical protein FVEN_g6621 [Fusarium venenatum]|uniref:major facilitator superfamily domain-containing protein n=1 Tax=Fusarium venenatum TaxID=56646 RepID=UPI001D63E3CB|nr:hypothetical protein FVEN_g6621 [Fusarium venenatum]KAH7006744.1 major facilitator superfamily domain-containing protein [Fusarium venenatum]